MTMTRYLPIHTQLHSFNLYNDKIHAIIEKNLSTYKKEMIEGDIV